MSNLSLSQAVLAASFSIESYNYTVQPKRGGDAEFELFCAADGLLRDLYKQYLEAKRQYSQVKQGGKAYDAMLDVAEESLDSAWCAVQTRLLELRADGILMQKIQHALIQKELEEQERQQQNQTKALKFWMFYHRALMMLPRKKTESYIVLAVFVLFLQYQWDKIQNHFNRENQRLASIPSAAVA